MNRDDLIDRLSRVKLLLLDVDGVLTDGSVIYSETLTETKCFSVRDGLGLRLLIRAGVQVGIITGRRSGALRRRCDELGIDMLYDGIRDKLGILKHIRSQTGLCEEDLAFVGDDLVDIPIMKRVGLSIAVGDAHRLCKREADLVTKSKGGRGAVRDICEAILYARGLWDDIIEGFHAG